MHDDIHPRKLLVTILPIANGRRLLATSNFCGHRYQWRLLRDGHQLSEGHSTTPYETVVLFDLKGPILPGNYRIELECLEDGFVLSSPSLPVSYTM